MVKRKIIVLMCMAFIFAALPAFDAGASAQQGQGKGKRGAQAGDGLSPGCHLNLNFTQEQTAKLQDVRNAFFKDTAGLRSDIFKKEQDMHVLMLEKTIDAEKAEKLQDEISALHAQIARKHLQAQLDCRKVLTPEQIGQLPPGCTMGIEPDGRGCGLEHNCVKGGGKRH
ncbi:MAG: Spy/CpxP family protein refolding chaperone [Pseudomonadota bacterium]